MMSENDADEIYTKVKGVLAEFTTFRVDYGQENEMWITSLNLSVLLKHNVLHLKI